MSAEKARSVVTGRKDPTASLTLRKNYTAAFNKRLRRVRGLIRTTVDRNDALRLGQQYRATRLADPREDFGIIADAPSRERAFMDWFEGALREEFLEETSGGRVRRGEHYTASFARAAYRKGLRFAESVLKKLGVSVPDTDIEIEYNFPIHQNALRLIYRRQYDLLEDITEDAVDDVSETLAEGFVEGVNPREMARRLNDRVDKLAQTRAEVLARTETIRTHSSSTLNRYDRVGGRVEGVTVKSELLTAQDSRVCPICEALEDEGRVYSTREMRNETFEYEAADGEPDSRSGEYPVKPPIHPQCRCCVVPIVN